MIDDSSNKLWDQLTDHKGPLGPEDGLWYGRFLTFLNDKKPRSVYRAFQKAGYGSKKSHGQVSVIWRDLVVEYRWKERAAAFDLALEEGRKREHIAQAGEVWDELYGGALKAAKTIVGLATDRRHLSLNVQKDNVRLKAAADVLDRLGFGKRAPRPMYAEADNTLSKPLNITLTNMTPEQLDSFAAWRDEDE